jgi:hypothetical protein
MVENPFGVLTLPPFLPRAAAASKGVKLLPPERRR